jgi:type IV fimbrial biogenesis protein FimT
MKPIRTHRGFSLIELMVTIALLAILTMLAAPNLTDFMKRSTVTTQTNELLGALQFARSTAVTRNAMVSICPSTTAANGTPTCAATNTFNTGWIIYTTKTANTAYSSTDELLRVFQGATNASIQGKPVASTQVVTFDARGTSLDGDLSFLVCAKADASAVGQSGVRSAGRSVNLQAGGRSAATVLGTSATASAAQTLCTAS